MKTKLLFLFLLLFSVRINAQQLTNGDELDNASSMKMNRMIPGDDNTFYAYRVRTVGKGTSYYIEKYDKGTLKPLFSKEVQMEEDRYTKVEDVKYAAGSVRIFIRQYNKKENRMSLFYRSTSSEGIVSPKMQELYSVITDHYEYIDFDVFTNTNATKFIVKASYKVSESDSYKTKFIFYEASTMKKTLEKSINQMLFSPLERLSLNGGYNAGEGDMVGFLADDDDNMYYGYSYMTTHSTSDEIHFILAIYSFKAAADIPLRVEAQFGNDFYVTDIMIKKVSATQLSVAGFYRDMMPHRGKELVKSGVFSLNINPQENKLKSKQVKPFDDKLLETLNLRGKDDITRWYRFKLDYMLHAGDADYYIGEEYNAQPQEDINPDTRNTALFWTYKYLDVLVAKLNANGEFEGVDNVPLRLNVELNSPLVYKQYIAYATPKAVYILADEDIKTDKIMKQKDYDAEDIKEIFEIPNSNFACTSFAAADGKMEHKILFTNDKYCFGPLLEKHLQFMPSSTSELFIPSKANEIIIHTDNKTKDRFTKIVFE